MVVIVCTVLLLFLSCAGFQLHWTYKSLGLSHVLFDCVSLLILCYFNLLQDTIQRVP